MTASASTYQLTALDVLPAILPEPEGDERIELRHIVDGTAHRYWTRSHDEAVALATALDGEGNLFFGVALRDGEYGDAAHVSRIGALWADVDAKCFADGLSGAARAIDAFPLRPSTIVATGGGYQPGWALQEPYHRDDEPRLRAVMRGINRVLSKHAQTPLDKVDDLARILRWPGSVNRKYDPPRIGHVERCDPTVRYDLTDFEDLGICDSLPVTPTRDLPVSDVIPEGSRNIRLASIAGSLRRQGLSQSLLSVALADINATRCNPPLPDAEVERIAWSVSRYPVANDPVVTFGGRSITDLAITSTQADGERAITLDDFLALPEQDRYVYRPTRRYWNGSAVNRLLPPQWTGRMKPKVDANGNATEVKEMISPAAWLTQHRRAEAVTWMPGQPEIIEDRYFVDGVWKARPGGRTYNLYQAPTWRRRDDRRALRVRPWLRLLQRLYPGEWEHILAWSAWRVQRPAVKINHALVLGGDQGIGKDSILDPVRLAVGPVNFAEASPAQAMGRFNTFVQSVILRVSELRDLGDVNRYSFYEHTKTLIAAPPETLTVDQKYLAPYSVPNLCGVIFTTNHRQGGLYLPADDRRHFVAWSEARREDVRSTYFPRLYRWLDAGGREEVAAYLAALDLDALDFRPQAPPPRTEAFWTMVDAGTAPETNDLTDALEALGNPRVITLTAIQAYARTMQRYSLLDWLVDKKTARQIPHRMAEAGYVVVRNPNDAGRGRWRIGGQRVAVYGRRDLSVRERLAAAEALR